MRTFLKVSSVLVLSFGVYYLLLGAAVFMSSDVQSFFSFL